jgi:molybdopterin synthase sulfur carrier subunit
MTINILAFGIARDILGASETTMELPDGITVDDLRKKLYSDYPELSRLASLAIARNNEYAEGPEEITERDEVVLIPPVSGG